MQSTWRQMPGKPGRAGETHGEAGRQAASDEGGCPRHATENTGSALLQAALTRENLRRAFKRVRANKGAAGVDGLDIDQTARHLATQWPVIRQQWLAGTYRPSAVHRVRWQSKGGRAGDGLAATSVRQIASDGQRGQECGCQCVWSQVSGLLPAGRAKGCGQARGGIQADGNVQAADQATEPALGRTKPARGGAASATVLVGLEILLRAGANTKGLACVGRMAAPPPAVRAVRDGARSWAVSEIVQDRSAVRLACNRTLR